MRAGDWIKAPPYKEGHRLSTDGVDAICGRPLVLPPEAAERWPGDWRLHPYVNKTGKCSECKSGEVDSHRRGMARTDGLPEFLARAAAANTRAPNHDVRSLAEYRNFEAIALRVQRELGGEFVVG